MIFRVVDYFFPKKSTRYLVVLWAFFAISLRRIIGDGSNYYMGEKQKQRPAAATQQCSDQSIHDFLELSVHFSSSARPFLHQELDLFLSCQHVSVAVFYVWCMFVLYIICTILYTWYIIGNTYNMRVQTAVRVAVDWLSVPTAVQWRAGRKQRIG